ncbi:response regulator [Anaerotignum sp.]|uniref:response regulator n=1 Tax=Anaerotignum sp. TaxID=2039241 RepID=UPI002714DB3E|nr:response regulator transcription factor [Anaerotignum sp.]
MKKIKVFLADDHKILRQSLVILLSQQENIEVVGEAADGVEAFKNILDLKPDIAILDISIPKLNGIDLAIKLKQSSPETKNIILTMHKSEEFVIMALQAGVKGYVLKDNALEELIQSIETVDNGNIFLSQGVTQLVVNGYLNNLPSDQCQSTPISSREREVLQLLAEGKSNKEISDLLCLSIKTVETHRSNIMHKLGFKSIIDLVLYAVRNHIIEP